MALEIQGIPTGNVYTGDSFDITVHDTNSNSPGFDTVSVSWTYDRNKIYIWEEFAYHTYIYHVVTLKSGTTSIIANHSNMSATAVINVINHKITLDAGHGLFTYGKQTPPDPETGIVTKEWTLNNNVCEYVKEYLNNYNVDIYRVDDVTGKAYANATNDKPVAMRSSEINAIMPELSISVHHNGLQGVWGTHNGVEVYYHSTKASRDKALAEALSAGIAQETGLRDRTAKAYDFHMVRETDASIPSLLSEGGSMDSTIDYPVIISESGQRAYARALANFCIDFLHLNPIA